MASYYDFLNDSPIDSWPQTQFILAFNGPYASQIPGSVTITVAGNDVDILLPQVLGTGTTGTYIYTDAIPEPYRPVSGFYFQPYTQNGTGGFSWGTGLLQSSGVMLIYPNPNSVAFDLSTDNNVGIYPTHLKYNVNV